MNYDEDYVNYYYERLEQMATETELQAEIKRMTNTIQQQMMSMQGMRQGYFQVGTLAYNVVNELMLALGDPEDAALQERAKRHGREWLKHWDETVEQARAAEMQAQKMADERNGKVVQLPPKEVLGPNGEPAA